MGVSFWKHHPGSDQIGERLAQITIDYQKRFGFDFVKLTPAGTWLAVCYGVVDQDTRDNLGRRTVTKPVITYPDDWQNLPVFGPDYQPDMLVEQLTASRLVCQAITDVDVYATVFSPLSQAIQLAGLNTFFEHITLYPEAVEAGLQRITQNMKYVFRQFVDTGVKGLFYVTQHTQSHVLSLADYKRVALRHDETCLQQAAALFNDTLIHLHGENVYWGLAVQLPRLRLHYGLHPTNPTPADLHNQAQLPVVAGLSTDTLNRVTCHQEARQLLERSGAGTLLTAGCVLPLDFADEQTQLWQAAAA